MKAAEDNANERMQVNGLVTHRDKTHQSPLKPSLFVEWWKNNGKGPQVHDAASFESRMGEAWGCLVSSRKDGDTGEKVGSLFFFFSGG